MKNCLVSILVLTAAFFFQSCNEVQKENKPKDDFGDTNEVFSDALPAVLDSFSIEVPSKIVVKKQSSSSNNAVYSFIEPSGKKMMSLYIGEHPMTISRFGRILSSNKGQLNFVGKKEIALKPKSQNKDVRTIHMISVGTQKSQMYLEFNYAQDNANADLLEKIVTSAKLIPQQN
ncbi:MAG: hypothetical protein MJZ05_05995 [Fibrobacter sp.]|nr:hypothetical protein [Fibrobacter sp.]